MNGLRTRNKLHADLHPDIHGDIVDVPERRGSGGRFFLGYKLYADHEPIPEVPYLRSAHGLGTPGEWQRDRAARLEQLYDSAFRICGALIVIAIAFVGYSYTGNRPEPVSPDVAYRVKAMALKPGTRVCQLDPHEGCLVCMHRDVTAMPVISTHC